MGFAFPGEKLAIHADQVLEHRHTMALPQPIALKGGKQTFVKAGTNQQRPLASFCCGCAVHGGCGGDFPIEIGGNTFRESSKNHYRTSGSPLRPGSQLVAAEDAQAVKNGFDVGDAPQCFSVIELCRTQSGLVQRQASRRFENSTKSLQAISGGVSFAPAPPPGKKSHYLYI